MRDLRLLVVVLVVSAVTLFGCGYQASYGIYQVTPTGANSRMTKEQARMLALELYSDKSPEVSRIEFGSISGPQIPKGTVGWAVSLSGLARTPVFVLIEDRSSEVLLVSSLGPFPAPDLEKVQRKASENRQ